MRILILVAACLLSFPAIANEFVAVGRVQKVTLMPYGTADCPDPCPVAATTKGGVCINLGCGCGQAKIAINHVLVGNPKTSILVKYQLNEWCDVGFPIQHPQVLVRVLDNGAPEWSDLVPLQSGGFAFSAKRFTRIGSVRISSLHAEHGLVPLSELKNKLNR